jgi:hypothetical protein
LKSHVEGAKHKRLARLAKESKTRPTSILSNSPYPPYHSPSHPLKNNNNDFTKEQQKNKKRNKFGVR